MGDTSPCERARPLCEIQRRQVAEWRELTPAEREETKEAIRRHRQMVHALVITDNRAYLAQSWEPMKDALQVVTHCSLCTQLTLSASVAIIADLIYRLHPDAGLTRADFEEAYRRTMGLEPGGEPANG